MPKNSSLFLRAHGIQTKLNKYFFLKDDFLSRYGVFMMLMNVQVFIFVYFLAEQALERMAASLSE